MAVAEQVSAVADGLPVHAFMFGSIFPVIHVYERPLTASAVSIM
jgi:hypothetical protein